MATYQTQPIVSDLGSQEFAQLLASYNELLDAFGDFVTTLKSASVIGDVVAAATTAETALEANVKKLQQNPNIPLAPAMPTTS